MDQVKIPTSMLKKVSAYDEVRKTNGNSVKSNSLSSGSSYTSSLDHTGTGVNLFSSSDLTSTSSFTCESVFKGSASTVRPFSSASINNQQLEDQPRLNFDQSGAQNFNNVRSDGGAAFINEVNKSANAEGAKITETRNVILPMQLLLTLSSTTNLFVVNCKPLRATPVSETHVLIRFDDLRHAKDAFDKGNDRVAAENLSGEIFYVTDQQYNRSLAGTEKIFAVDEIQGHAYVLVTSMIGPLKQETFLNQALAEIKNFGALHVAAEIVGTQGTMTSCFGLHLEFCALRECDKFTIHFAIRKPTKLFKSVFLQAMSKKDLLQALSHWSVEPVGAFGDASQIVTQLEGTQMQVLKSNSSNALAQVVTLTPSDKHDVFNWNPAAMYQSPPSGSDESFVPQYAVPRSGYSIGLNGIIPQGITRGAPSLLRQPTRGAGHLHNNNPVDINRIMRGEDVRTTIMLRNIPNKMNCHELKLTIDTYVRGCFDFSYLRIDFTNGMNVGYAFINFSHPSHIARFAMAMQHRRWDVYNSDKHAEISYATKQGIHSLIDAFRNSSVMEEHPDARPKLWYTDMDKPELAGQERPFPASDNHLKLQRSRDNKRSNGLYAAHRARADFGFSFSGNGRSPLHPSTGYGFGQQRQASYSNAYNIVSGNYYEHNGRVNHNYFNNGFTGAVGLQDYE